MNALSPFPGARSISRGDDLMARYRDVNEAAITADLAGLKDARARRLPATTKMYQAFVVRAYLFRRAHRRIA